jgi:hypothetical protein
MNNNARCFDLTDGWEIGERVYKTITVMEPNALDILNARQAAEETKVVHYDGGQEIAVVVSPTSAVLELMRRQISQLDGEDTRSWSSCGARSPSSTARTPPPTSPGSSRRAWGPVARGGVLGEPDVAKIATLSEPYDFAWESGSDAGPGGGATRPWAAPRR